jgi:hypothetical protein
MAAPGNKIRNAKLVIFFLIIGISIFFVITLRKTHNRCSSRSCFEVFSRLPSIIRQNFCLCGGSSVLLTGYAGPGYELFYFYFWSNFAYQSANRDHLF